MSSGKRHHVYDGPMPEGSYDVVIVGSGMGGLSSAAILAKEGLRVCVLEQHYRVGGCLHRFFRDRVPFDTGFHYFGGVGEGGTMARYLRYFGVYGALKFHPLDPDGFDVFRFPGLTFRMPNGWGPYLARLKETFPHERAGIEQFGAACQKVVDDSPAYSFKPLSMESGKYAGTALGPFLRSCIQDEKLRAVICGNSFLYGVEPENTPLELHALVTDSMLQGAAGVDGGGDALAKAMVDAIHAMGGKVRTRSGVKELRVHGKRVTTAVLHTGEEIHGRLFISNAHPQVTLDLLPPEALTPIYKDRIRGMKNGLACIAGYFQAREHRGPVRNHNLYLYPHFDVDGVYANGGFGEGHGENKGLFVTFPSDRETRWKGPPVLLALGLMDWKEVARWSETKTGKRGDEYAALKEKHGRAMQRVLEASLPEYEGQLEAIEISTPLSNRDYTATPEGAVYGIRRSMDQWGKYGLHARTKLENLLLTGQSILMPGVVGVTVGAAVTCSFVIGYEYLFGKIARA